VTPENNPNQTIILLNLKTMDIEGFLGVGCEIARESFNQFPPAVFIGEPSCVTGAARKTQVYQ
jgi:hypothetical protein